MNQLRGKIVLIDFWTYSCINCLRTLPHLSNWYEKYKDKDFVVIGVHTPEFEFEKDPKNVQKAIERLHIHYPVALDNDYQTWQAFGNMYWPAHYLVDRKGIIRQIHYGEGAYIETENEIRELLGLPPLNIEQAAVSHRPITLETYLGYNRASGYPATLSLQRDKTAHYSYTPPLEADQAGLSGDWFVGPENIVAEGNDSQLDLNFQATRVYLVLRGKSDEPITISLDGKPLDKKYWTKDMDENGKLFVHEPRKYDIVNLHENYGRHLLSLHIPKGIAAYAFTFGDEP